MLAWSAEAMATDFTLPVLRHELANGMVILTLEDHSVPVTTFYAFYRVGSRNERAGITGLSHFFEHMMFNGAEKYGPKMFDKMLESAGGYSNAWTSNDITAYFEDFASDQLELVLDLESDRMRGLLFDPDLMESERGVVAEERRSRTDNDPAGAVDELMFATAFVAHPYHWPVVGWMADIESYTREDCLDYFKTYYAPNNVVVILSGDFDTDEAMKLVRQYFGELKPGPEVRSVVRSEPRQKGERRAVIEMPAQVPIVVVGYHVPEAAHADAHVLEVLKAIMSSGESSRLYRNLVYEREIAIDIYVDYWLRFDPNLMYFYIEVNPDSSLENAESYLHAEIARLSSEPVTDAELQKAKNKLTAGFYRQLKTNNGRAGQLGEYHLLLGDYKTLMSVPARYEAVTSEDIQRVAQTYFADRLRTVITLVPSDEEDDS